MISIVVATDSKRGIGKNGKLPWYIPEELKYFHKVTNSHPIIMGRKTFESIGRVLPGRTNIIITRSLVIPQSISVILNDSEGSLANASSNKLRDSSPAKRVQNDKIIITNSLEEAISEAKKAPGSEEICIIGGGQIFEQALPMVDRLYITVVEGDFGADTFFPDYSEFKKVVSEIPQESSGHKYKLMVLER